MTESRPQLRAVPGTPEKVEGEAEGPAESPPKRRALGWLLGVGLAAAGLGWVLEAQESRQLAVSLEATSLALAEARQELAAWEGHVGQAREQATALVLEASGLAERLAALEAMLADGPTVSPDTEPGTSEP